MNRKCGNCKYWLKYYEVKGEKGGLCNYKGNINKLSFEKEICENHNYDDDIICGNCKYYNDSLDLDCPRCTKDGIDSFRVFSDWSCSEHEYKQENKMKIEQYTSKEQIEPVKKYPKKWMASVNINGEIVLSFVSEFGEHISYLDDGCKDILESEKYETDFADWGENDEFIRFKEGWY